MKSLLLTLPAIIFSLFSFAQPTLNSITVPDIGTSYNIYESEGVMSAGPAGADQVWDLSPMVFDADPVTNTFVDPSSTDYISDFPTANIAIDNQGGDFTKNIFFNLNNLQFEDLGYVSTDRVLPYSNTIINFTYPFAYNEVQEDTYAGTANMSGIIYELTGSTSLQYDGYGTLITSKGTFTNVVRFKDTRSETHITTAGTVVYNYGLEMVSYSWYIPGNIIPIFTVANMDMYEDGNITMQETLVAYFEHGVTANRPAKLQKLSISVSPNPVTDQTIIDFKDLPTDQYEVEVTDASGHRILQESLSIRKGDKHTLNLEHLAKGIYLVHLSSSHGKGSHKLVKY